MLWPWFFDIRGGCLLGLTNISPVVLITVKMIGTFRTSGMVLVSCLWERVMGLEWRFFNFKGRTLRFLVNF